MGISEKGVLWRRRQALQLVAQLPENAEDALAVLDYARDLVVNFLGAGALATIGLGGPPIAFQSRLHLVEASDQIEREAPALPMPEPIKR